MVTIEQTDLQIYREKLSGNWWDGRFKSFFADVVVSGEVEKESTGDGYYWRKEVCSAFVGDSAFCDLVFFSELKDGYFTSYPAFGVCPSRNRRYSKREKIELFFDPVGYAAKIDGDEITCYNPLMLRPFRRQTGYCIGAIFREKSLGKNFQRMYIVSAQELCDKVKWQDLVKFAKPYDDYFAVAHVEQVPVKSFCRDFESYEVVPLYIGEWCVAVRLPGGYQGKFEYISYAEYMEKF